MFKLFKNILDLYISKHLLEIRGMSLAFNKTKCELMIKLYSEHELDEKKLLKKCNTNIPFTWIDNIGSYVESKIIPQYKGIIKTEYHPITNFIDMLSGYLNKINLNTSFLELNNVTSKDISVLESSIKKMQSYVMDIYRNIPNKIICLDSEYIKNIVNMYLKYSYETNTSFITLSMFITFLCSNNTFKDIHDVLIKECINNIDSKNNGISILIGLHIFGMIDHETIDNVIDKVVNNIHNELVDDNSVLYNYNIKNKPSNFITLRYIVNCIELGIMFCDILNKYVDKKIINISQKTCSHCKNINKNIAIQKVITDKNKYIIFHPTLNDVFSSLSRKFLEH